MTSRRLLCPQTDTSDPEKVVSAFLKVSSVFKDEASVRTAVQDAVGACGGAARTAPASSLPRARLRALPSHLFFVGFSP